MRKIVRILELTWLTIAIAGIILGAYMTYTGDTKQAIYFFALTIFGGIFYFFRRRQRMRLDEQERQN